MTTVAHAPSAAIAQTSTHDKVLFWGCFIALVTTAFGFIARMFLINTWAAEFNLDPAQAGRVRGGEETAIFQQLILPLIAHFQADNWGTCLLAERGEQLLTGPKGGMSPGLDFAGLG